MVARLVAGGDVVTVDAAGTIHESGYVFVRDGVITEVGADRQREGRLRDDADDVLDARGCVVVPGFINTHQHHWYNLFKGLGGGMLLERWIYDLLVPTGQQLQAADLRVSSALACLEMLRTGTTACLNHQVTDTDDDKVAAILEPVAASGMRQVIAKEIRPQRLSEQLELAEAVHRRWDGAADGRIRVAFAIESTAHWVALGTSSEELILRGDELAARLGVRITDHVAGGTMSRDDGYLKFVIETGRTDIEYLHALGVLDSKWVLAHAIHCRDRDIGLIAQAGAHVAHTPTSESSRAAGITPVARMLAAGINVALGTDGPMVDTSVDVVEQMKAVRLFQNQLHLNPSAITPGVALEMATIRAARAVGLDEMIGSLEPGKRADVAVFDLDTPWSTVWHHPVTALVGSVRGLDARHVLVDGEPLVRDGAFTRVDDSEFAAVLADARTHSAELLHRAGLEFLVQRAARTWKDPEPAA